MFYQFKSCLFHFSCLCSHPKGVLGTHIFCVIHLCIEGYNQNGAIDRYIKSEPTLSDNQRMTAGHKRRLDEENHTSEEGDGKLSRYAKNSAENQLFTLPPSLQISPKPNMSLVDENIAVNDSQAEQKHPDFRNTFIQSSGIHPIFALIFLIYSAIQFNIFELLMSYFITIYLYNRCYAKLRGRTEYKGPNKSFRQ